MKSIKEIRRDNLKTCVDEAGSPVAFIQKFGHLYGQDGKLSPSYLSQMLSGASPIGNAAAEKLETAMGKPRHWLDRGATNFEDGPESRGEVPVISWVQAGQWCDATDPFLPGVAEDWLPCPVKHGSRAFALRVRGVSMENTSGKYSYSDGDIIYVDPDKQAENGSRVIVRLDDQKEATFKQLVIEGDHKYLKALNPAWPDKIIEINGNATICGVIIGKWVPE